MKEISKKVILELLQNSRRPISTIAKTPYLTRDIVTYQMATLEKSKYIKGYTAQIQQHFFCSGVAHVRCKLSLVTKKTLDEAITFLQTHTKVTWIGSVCGNADIVFTFLYNSVVEMQQTLDSIVHKINAKDHFLSLYTEELKFNRSGILTEKPQVTKQVLPKFIAQEITLDSQDKTILHELALNARITNRELAHKTELGEDSIRYRIKSLEKKGVITGYTTILDTNKLGFEGYLVYIHTQADKHMIQSFAQQQPFIIYCAQMSGTYNYVFSFLAKNRTHFTEILQELRNTFAEEINAYDVLLLLNEHKEIYLPETILEK